YLNDDRMFDKVRDDWLNFTEQKGQDLNDEEMKAIENLIASYTEPDTLEIQKYQHDNDFDFIEFLPELSDEPLDERYEKALEKCRNLFGRKSYESEMAIDPLL
ncbi:10603_t:CDS:1, partial [Ambispora leptoticha]